MSASHPSRATHGVVLERVSVAASRTPVSLAAIAPIPRQTRTMTAVTAGPAIATLNSSPGVCESRVSLATPPKSQRSMPEVPIPSRRAISAWPSSWSRSEAKKKMAAATAVT